MAAIDKLRKSLVENYFKEDVEPHGLDDETIVELMIQNIEQRPHLTKIYFTVINSYWPHLLERIKKLSVFI